MPGTTDPRGAAARRKTKDAEAETALCEAIASLPDAALCRRFLYDLCTPKELADMADRWWVARLLDEGKLSYRDIHKLTGVSVTTVGRVARFLDHESFQGYRAVLASMKQKAS